MATGRSDPGDALDYHTTFVGGGRNASGNAEVILGETAALPGLEFMRCDYDVIGRNVKSSP